ncbi:MAG TPA: NrsF family protein [Stellaceae bacterium]|nr:NrsF family protein [Stellaceae bacterium]
MKVSGATERLIERLAADATPMRRLPPPAMRTVLWLLPVAALAAIGILVFSDLRTFLERARDPKLAIELAATLVTGIAGVLAAFELSLPDRSRLWALLPLPTLALWIASSGYSCYRHWIAFGPEGWEIGESSHCLAFILATGLPLGASLLLLLRRACPLSPIPVAAMGGLGVAGIAAFLLQFFHPFDVTFMDLGVHLVAVGLVVAVLSLLAKLPPRDAAARPGAR